MEKHIKFANKIRENNQFFKHYYSQCDLSITKENFLALPTLDKETLQLNYSNLLQLDVQRDVEIIETSGTTGIPLKVYWYKDEFIKSNFYTWCLRKKWYGIVPNMKFCTFHSSTTSNSNFEKIDAVITNGDRTLSLGRYVYNENVLKSYISMMDEFAAEWILGPPSVLQVLSKHMTAEQISLPSIRYIELNGEYVDESTYNIIKEAFPEVQISNLYGSTEFNGIALTCPYGNMHILENNVFVETIEEEGISCIYITGLVNTAMPLIRYKIGDVGVLEDCNCPCGNKHPILKLSNGRINEILALKKNINLDPAAFNSVINAINCEDYIVNKFQIKVLSESNIMLVLLINEKYKEANELFKLRITNSLKQINSELNYTIHFVYDEKNLLNNKSKFSFVCYD